jgi:hypothetical protein
MTAGLGLLFAVGGAAVGTTYNYLKTNNKWQSKQKCFLQLEL